MNTAEKIFDEVQTLPEFEAREVLDFVEFLKGRRDRGREVRRDEAMARLDKFAGRYDGTKFNRDELYDRPGLH